MQAVESYSEAREALELIRYRLEELWRGNPQCLSYQDMRQALSDIGAVVNDTV